MSHGSADYWLAVLPDAFQPLLDRITIESQDLRLDDDSRRSLAYALAQRAIHGHDLASYGLAMQFAADQGLDVKNTRIYDLVKGWDDMATCLAATPTH